VVIIGMTLRRFLSSCMVETSRAKLVRQAGALQAGLSVKNGCESIVHTVRTLLGSVECDSDDDPLVLIEADVKNAFFAPSRARTFELLRKYFPGWLRYYVMSWHGDSIVRSGAHEITITSGFWIGLPDAGFLFLLNLLNTLETLRDEKQAHTLMSNVDNLYFICRKSKAPGLLARTVSLLGQAHLKLKPAVNVMSLSRNQVLETSAFQHPGENTGHPPDDLRELAQVNTSVVDAMKILGIRVAHESKSEVAAMKKKLDGIVEMAEKVIKNWRCSN